MAIADKRIGLKNVVESSKSSFIDAVDKSKDTPNNKASSLSKSVKSALNKKARANGMSSYLKNNVSSVNDKAVKIGIHDTTKDGSCNGTVIKSDSSPEDRSLMSSRSYSMPACSNDTASFLSDLFNKVTAITTGIANISDSSLANIESMVSKEVSSLHKSLPTTKGLVADIDVAKSVAAGFSNVGLPLKVRGELLDYANRCNKTSGSYTVGDFDFLNMQLLDNLLNIGDCLVPEVLLSMISGILSAGTSNTSDVITSYTKNFNTPEDPKAVEKVRVLSAVLNDTNSTRTASDKAKTKGGVDSVLNSISKSKESTPGPATDYHVTVSALDNLDDKWDKDTEGNPNYSKVKGNKHMGRLATASLQSSNPSSELTTTPTISPDKLRSISIVASANH